MLHHERWQPLDSIALSRNAANRYREIRNRIETAPANLPAGLGFDTPSR
jgi:hypothetical protein